MGLVCCFVSHQHVTQEEIFRSNDCSCIFLSNKQ